MKSETVDRSSQMLDRLYLHTPPVYARRSLEERTSSETSLRCRSTFSPNHSRLQHKQATHRRAHGGAPQQESARNGLEDWLMSQLPNRIYFSDNPPTFAAVATFSLRCPRDRLRSHYPESFTHLINHGFTQRQLVPIEKLCVAACAIPSCIPISAFIIPPHVLTTAWSTMQVLAIKFRQPVTFPALQQTAAVASELLTRFARFALLVRKAIVASTKPWRLSLLGLLL